MKKRKTNAFGKDVYLLGKDEDGIFYWLEKASWDCDWYWGGGYVETYTNNEHPEYSRDIESHQHFDGLFFNKRKNGFDLFNEFFAETPLTKNEIWELCELMKSFYIAREYSDMLYRGGAHYTSNPAKEAIKNEEEYERINKIVIPAIMDEVYKLLSPDE